MCATGRRENRERRLVVACANYRTDIFDGTGCVVEVISKGVVVQRILHESELFEGFVKPMDIVPMTNMRSSNHYVLI